MATVKNTSNPAMPSLTFLYHELGPEKSDYSYALEVQHFEQQVKLFLRMRRLQEQVLWPEITFDDGHLSNYQYALPVLIRHNMAAHFFITVGWTGKAGYMGWAELRALHQAGHRIGAHGWSHTLLTRCSPLMLTRELEEARKTLEDKLGSRITSMSLPGGRYNRRVLAQCEASGYTEVFTSIPRSETGRNKLLRGRVNVHSGLTLPTLEKLLQPGSTDLAKLARRYRLKQAARNLLGDELYAKAWAIANKHQPDAHADLMTTP